MLKNFYIILFLSSLCVFGRVHASKLRDLQAVSCPSSGGYTGDSRFIGNGPKGAPTRGAVACVDNPIDSSKVLVYGPLEAGFTSAQLKQFFKCSTDATIPGGLDTKLAEELVEYDCNLPVEDVSVLDSCGGHANPYHYHEKMSCLYDQDPVTGHSTRVATALDGNGLYGKFIDGGLVPTDLDACGGRTGVTPDSDGKEVYYYVIQDTAPFTIGCFGPVSSIDECRALYSGCGDGDTLTITTAEGSILYDPECPCYDKSLNGSNVPGQILYTDIISSSNIHTYSTILTILTTMVIVF